MTTTPPTTPTSNPVVKAITRVSPVMPEPVMVPGTGRPDANQYVPTVNYTSDLGWFQIELDDKDVTFFRGVPAEIEEITSQEPWGPSSARIKFPSVTPFERTGVGTLSWIRLGRPAVIRLIDRTGAVDTVLFRGFIASIDAGVGLNAQGDIGVVIDLQGILFQAEHILAQPRLIPVTRDLGAEIAATLNAIPGRRYKPCVEVGTGVEVRASGSWEPTLTGFLQDLLAEATTDDGLNQWTVGMDEKLRRPVVKLKDMDTKHWTISLGAPGFDIQLSRDATQSPNVIYGSGVDDKGNAWANLKAPNMIDPSHDKTYPFIMPDDVLVQGMTDADCDLDKGVTRLRRRLKQCGYGITVGDTFTAHVERAVRAYQGSSGLVVDGEVGPQTWNSLFRDNDTGTALDNAHYGPLATTSYVEPKILTGDGQAGAANDEYDPDKIRVERFHAFADGTTKLDAFRIARAELKRDREPGWVGTITLHADPDEGSKWRIKAGDNIGIKWWRDRDDWNPEEPYRLLHISQVRYAPTEGTVTLTVDTQARDRLTVDAVRRRDRDAVDPARRSKKARRRSALTAGRPTVDSELIGHIDDVPTPAGIWTVFRLVMGLEGNIVKVDLSTSPATRFAVAFFGSPITPNALASNIGNSLQWRNDDAAPFSGDDATQQWLQDNMFIDAIGAPEQAAGYFPGAEDQETAVTGKHFDEGISLHYESLKPPYVWVAVYTVAASVLNGRVWQSPQGW